MRKGNSVTRTERQSKINVHEKIEEIENPLRLSEHYNYPHNYSEYDCNILKNYRHQCSYFTLVDKEIEHRTIISS